MRPVASLSRLPNHLLPEIALQGGARKNNILQCRERVIAMPAPKREIRLQIVLSKDELELLDDWRFMNRMPTRAAAFRELLDRGMTMQHEEEPSSRPSGNARVLTRH
jgi:hypothetical protein